MAQEEKREADQDSQKQDMPTKEQRDVLERSVKKLLNPDGTNPHMDGYVTNTFDYISGMLDKMANSSDKDATAQDIAEDLKAKYEAWAAQFESGEEKKAELGDKIGKAH